MVTKIGLDLGYANITLSDATAGIYREPSVALVNKNTRAVISVGNSAVSGQGGTNPVAMLVRPFKNGILFDSKITQGIINSAILPIPLRRLSVQAILQT